MYYDKQGKEITAEEFSRLHTPEYATVCRTESNGWLISTVWLGIDHSFGDSTPIIFETMIFRPGADDSPSLDEVYCSRYSTENEAMDGHVRAMKWLIEELVTGGFNEPEERVP